MPADLTDSELDQLAELLDAAPEPLAPLSVPALDGYLVGVLVQPRRVPIDEWLPPLFDLQRRGLPAEVDAEWLARCRALIERRHDALNAQIAELGGFDPVLADESALPPASEYDTPQSLAARVLEPWFAGFEWALECFPELDESGDAAIDAALDRLWAPLDPDNASPDLDAAVEALVAAGVDLWDLTAKQRYAVATLRRDTPKVGRNEPCPCGSGKKFKVCHGTG
jgi:uncharacterized protein